MFQIYQLFRIVIRNHFCNLIFANFHNYVYDMVSQALGKAMSLMMIDAPMENNMRKKPWS